MTDRAFDDSAAATSRKGVKRISRQELRDMIAGNAITGIKGRENGLRMPDESELDTLVEIINHWLGFYEQARAAAPLAKAVACAEHARDELRKLLPTIAEGFAIPGDPIWERNYKQIKRVYYALENLAFPQPTLYRAPEVPDQKLHGQQIPDWRWIVGVLHADFSRALGKMGARDDGPAARLLSALFTHAGVGKAAPETVARFLRGCNRADP